MILQYGNLSAWNYTEADTICVSFVNLREIKKSSFEEFRNADNNNGKNEVLNTIGKQIKTDTRSISFELFKDEKDFEDLDEVIAIQLIRKENPYTLILPKRGVGAYLLSDSGKTVQKIK